MTPTRRRPFRTWLALGTALSGFAALPLAAQTLPPPMLPGRADADVVRGSAEIGRNNGRLDVDLKSQSTVIDWRGNGFNIPEGTEARFTDGRSGGLLGSKGQPQAVLNRDLSGTNPSQLLGRLTSDPNIAVWVYNPNGIIVGQGAAINTGSLVLTTIEPNEDAFVDNSSEINLVGGATSAAGIEINGAQIRVQGGSRGLVMVAPKIDAEGQFEAVGQDIAFVTATDVTLRYGSSGGPLSVTINKGTSVPGISQYVKGTVAGNDAIFALASQGSVTDALLQVDAEVTTASEGTRGIVLSAGKVTTGVALSETTGDADGNVGLTVNGLLRVNDRDSGVTARANGAVAITGEVRAPGNYTVEGTGVTLGGASAVTQRVGGAVSITSNDGALVGRTGLTLRGDGDLTLKTTGTAGGDVLFGGTAVRSGSDDQVLVDRGLEANLLVLGDVTAGALRGTVAGAQPGNGLTVLGGLTLGDVSVADDLIVTAGGLTAGTLSSGRAVTLTSTAGITADGVAAANGSAKLSAAGAIGIAGTVSAGGQGSDVTLVTPGAITLGGIAANRSIVLGNDTAAAASVAVTGNVVAGFDYTINAGTVTLGTAGTAVSQRVAGTIDIRAGVGGITGLDGLSLVSNADGVGTGPLTLAIDSAAAGMGGGAINFAPSTLIAGGTQGQSDVRIRSADAAGTVTLGDVVANNLVGAVGTAEFATGILRTGAIVVGDTRVNGALLLDGASVTTGALSSNGAVTLTGSSGAVTTGGSIAAGGTLTIRGASIALGGDFARAGGAIDLTATVGGIASTGAYTLTSTSTRPEDFVRLQATGAEGIRFAAGSAIVAGRDRALRVGVFNAAPGAPLDLGDVTARSLGSLAAFDGDATLAGGSIVSSAPLTFGRLDLVDGFTARSTGGGLTIGSIRVTGAAQAIDLTADAGTIVVGGDLDAPGDVRLTSAGAIQLDDVTGGGIVSLTSGGTVVADTVTGRGRVEATGTGLTLGTVDGGDVVLRATTGDLVTGFITGAGIDAGAALGSLRVAGADATGALTLTAATGLTATGRLTATGSIVATAASGVTSITAGLGAGGDATIGGGSVTLGGQQRAGGNYTASASAGTLTGARGLSITAGTDAGRTDAVLTLGAIGGAVAIDRGTTLRSGVNADRAVTITTDGGVVAIGRVDAGSLTIGGSAGAVVGSIVTGELALRGALSLTAANGIETGGIGVAAGGATLDAGAGTLTAGTIDVRDVLDLSGADLDVGNLTGTSVLATARTGRIDAGTVTATAGDATLVAVNGVTAGTIEAGGSATADAGAGLLRLDDIDAAGVVTLTGGDIEFGTVDGAGLTATATAGAIDGGRVTVDDAINVGATGSVTLGRLEAVAGLVDVRGSAVSLGDVTAAGALTAIASGGTTTLGVIDVGGTATLVGTSLGFTTLDAAGVDATATAGGVDGGTVTAAGGVRFGATGQITLGDVTARAGDLTLTGIGITAGNLEASRTIDAIGGAGVTSVGTVDAGGLATLTGGSLDFGTVAAAGLTAAASTGALRGGDVTVAGGATFNAAGSATLGTVVARAGDATITSGGTMTVAGVTAGGVATLTTTGPAADIVVTNGVQSQGNATVTATGDIRAPFIRSLGGDLTVAAPNGSLSGIAPGQGTSLSAGPGGAFSLTIGTAARLGDIVGGRIAISATSLGVDSVDADEVTLSATRGDLTVYGLVKANTATLSATGRTRLADVEVGGLADVSGGAGVSFNDISAGALKVRSGGIVTGRDLAIDGLADVVGGSIALRGVDAGSAVLTATSGDIGLDTLVTDGAATLTSAGGARVDDAEVGGVLTLTATGGVGFSTLSAATIAIATDGAVTGGELRSAGLTTVRGGTIAARGATVGSAELVATGDLSIDTVDTPGDARLTGGTARVGRIDAGGAITLIGTRGAGFDTLSGAAVTVESDALIDGTTIESGGQVVARGGAVMLDRVRADGATLVANAGDLGVGDLGTNGAATLSASGGVGLDLANVGGALGIDAAGAQLGAVSGGTIRVAATGAVAGSALTAGGSLDVTGGSVALGDVNAGGPITANALAGDLTVATLAGRGDAALSASGLARVAGGVDLAGAYRVVGASVVLGDGTAIVQQARGPIAIRATGGDITGASGLTLASGVGGAAPLSLDATGAIALAGTRIRTGAALGLRAGSGRTIRLGSVEAASIGSFDGTQIAAALTHDGAFTADDVAVRDLAVSLSAGDLTLGTVGASGSLTLRTGAGRIATGAIRAGAVDLTSAGTLATGGVTASGAAKLSAAAIATGDVTAASVEVRTPGTLAGIDGGRTSLTATGGNLTVDAGTARLQTASAGGDATITGGTIDVAGRLAASRQLLAEARQALTLGETRSGAGMTLKSGGALATGVLDAGGTIDASGAGVGIAGARSGAAMTLTSTRDLSLGDASAAGGVTIDAAGLASLRTLSGGPSVSIVAGDAALGGAVRAANVAFATKTPAATAMRIGDGTAADGFRLSADEVALVAADTLRFDAGPGTMEIGTLPLAAASGRQVAMLGTGTIRVTGAVSTPGGGRAIRIGGTATDPASSATTLHVVATEEGGGRLLVDGSDLTLNADRIAVGLATGFIDTLLPGDPGRAQANALIGDANSALYNAQLGGGFFAPDATTTVSARSLTLRFADYALFQNTALPGSEAGVVIGGVPGAQTGSTLRVTTTGASPTASFALFGSINGTSGAAAALLGAPVIDVDPSLLPNSRINGCLAGSGAGCLTTIVIQPTLQVFNWNTEDVFGISQDVAVPFTPIVAGNNEALLSDLPELVPNRPLVAQPGTPR